MSSKQIIEPISTMGRLIMLNFYPTGTKIMINEHRVTIQKKTDYQGLMRFYQTQSLSGREQISQIMDVILRLIYWFHDFEFNLNQEEIDLETNNSDEEIDIEEADLNQSTVFDVEECDVKYLGQLDDFKELLKYFTLGLKKLQETYESGNVFFTLQYYINLLEDFQNGTYSENKVPVEYFKEWKKRESYLKKEVLRNMWSPKQIGELKNRFAENFSHMENRFIKSNEKETLIKGNLKAITSLLETRENEFISIVKETNQG